jgi:sec-independent protein translocase protein TatA
MPFHMGPWEIGLILVVILVIFGVGKLPQVGTALGKGIGAFRKAREGEDEDSGAAGKTIARSRAGRPAKREVKA